MRDLKTALVAVVLITAVLGVGFPLAMTGIGRVVFPHRADGSLVVRDGRPVGSALIGQDFRGQTRYFQSRPSATSYSANATAFDNQGPYQAALAHRLKGYVARYLALERPYDRGLTAAKVPADAVTTSASGVDPDISEANARIQARRVAAVRRLPLATVLAAIDAHASRPLLGLAGPKSVDVLALNLALDDQERS
jgi:K+-transporting ATPase ATPase C chain